MLRLGKILGGRYVCMILHAKHTRGMRGKVSSQPCPLSGGNLAVSFQGGESLSCPLT